MTSSHHLRTVYYDPRPFLKLLCIDYEAVLKLNYHTSISGYGNFHDKQISQMTVEDWSRKEQYCRDVAKAVENLEPRLPLLNGKTNDCYYYYHLVEEDNIALVCALSGLISLELADSLLRQNPSSSSLSEVEELLSSASSTFAWEDPTAPEGAAIVFKLKELKGTLHKKQEN